MFCKSTHPINSTATLHPRPTFKRKTTAIDDLCFTNSWAMQMSTHVWAIPDSCPFVEENKTVMARMAAQQTKGQQGLRLTEQQVAVRPSLLHDIVCVLREYVYYIHTRIILTSAFINIFTYRNRCSCTSIHIYNIYIYIYVCLVFVTVCKPRYSHTHTQTQRHRNTETQRHRDTKTHTHTHTTAYI